MPTYAEVVEGIRTVSGATERDSVFPTPEAGHKVWRKDVAQIEEYDGTAWITALVGCRKHVAVYDVKNYGAVGDGSNASSALSKILTIIGTPAQLGAGATIFWPAGSYQLTGTFTIPRNVRMLGEGMRATVIARTSDAPMFDLGDFTQLMDMRIEGGSTTYTSTVTRITAGHRERIERVEFANIGTQSLTIVPDQGSGFVAIQTVFSTTGTLGSVPSVRLTGGADSMAVPRFFYACDGAGSTMIDIGGMNNLFFLACGRRVSCARA